MFSAIEVVYQVYEMRSHWYLFKEKIIVTSN